VEQKQQQSWKSFDFELEPGDETRDTSSLTQDTGQHIFLKDQPDEVSRLLGIW
jgi:hypothetical protein